MNSHKKGVRRIMVLDILLTISAGIQIYLGTNNAHLALAGVSAILVLVSRERV